MSLICSHPLPSNKIKDIRGERFGRLVVASFSHVATHNGRNAMWSCLCDCGNTSIVDSGALRSGSTQSCGCLGSETSRKLIKKLHDKGKHLYLIQCGPYCKIGRADSPELRLVQVKSMCPYPCTLDKVFKNLGHKEHELHDKYKHLLHTGEWFKINQCEVNL